MPLDVATLAGGPLKAWFGGIAEPLWLFNVAAFQAETVGREQSKIRVSEAHRILRRPSRLLCFTEDSLACRRIFGDSGARIVETSRESLEGAYGMQEWAREIFASCAADADFFERLEAYADEFPEARGFPWEGLRFFSVRLERPQAQLDWGRFRALFSPQDELEAGLADGVLMLNPTLQILPQATLVARREGFRLAERVLNAPEAALVDELSEKGRCGREELLLEATGPLLKLGAADPGALARALDALIAEGFVLKG